MAEGTALRSLIRNLRGDRNNAELSRDCGGIPTQSRIQQMANLPIKLFPDPATMKGLARGLNISVWEVVAACAKDLDLGIGGPGESDLFLAGARDLPESSQRLLISMSRELQDLAAQAKATNS